MYCGDVCKYGDSPEVSVMTGSQSRRLTGLDCILFVSRDRGWSKIKCSLSDVLLDWRWAVADATVATRVKDNDPTRNDNETKRDFPSTVPSKRINLSARRAMVTTLPTRQRTCEKSCKFGQAGLFAQ